MKRRHKLDDDIASIVQRIDLSPSPDLEAKINTSLDSSRFGSKLRQKLHARRLIRTAIPSAVAVLLVTILAILFLSKPPTPYVSEIRTEFELPEMNITGIFIQRSDFNFFEEVKK
jgi:hypothetical protein